MSRAIKSLNDQSVVLSEGLRNLSRTAARFLRQRPKEAQIAVVAALEAAAVQFEADTGSDAVPESLKRFVVPRRYGADVIGVTEAAERLEVSRTTVYDWVEKGTLLGWKSTKRGLTIPAEQIVGAGRVVSGMSEVLDVIGNAELAWEFLANDWPFADEVARPIDKLISGQVEDVVNAAPSFGSAFM